MATIPEALTSAIQHHQSGRLQAAELIYRQILQVEPNHHDALHLLGVIAYQAGKHEIAVEYLGRAIQLKPDYAVAHSNLGNVLKDQGKLAEAIDCYRRALRLNPDYAEAHNNLGNALWEQGKVDEAVDYCRRALQLKPDFAGAHNNLGNALWEQGKQEEAVASFRRALQLKPDFAVAHNNLGNALREEGKLAEAVDCYRRALQLQPDYAETHNNLGNALWEQGMLEEAVHSCRRALQLKPDLAEAHRSLGMISLLRGNFEQGWSEYEWRRQCKDIPRLSFPRPLWDGASLTGKTILLYSEQGLGDTLQFIRYAPLVKKKGGTVLFECPVELVKILQNCAGIDQIVPRGYSLPFFDVQAPLLSLPGILGTTLSTIPADIPYLRADASLVEYWSQEINALQCFKIGIVWQGNPAFPGDRHRSVPIRHFQKLAPALGVRLVSLQVGPGTDQLAGIPFRVFDLGSQFNRNSLDDLAAAIVNLDLIITVDTAAAHLAAALGVPVWTLLTFVPDWRWLLDREDSPWYPTMRLFRQKKMGDWGEVFERISVELRDLVATRTGS